MESKRVEKGRKGSKKNEKMGGGERRRSYYDHPPLGAECQIDKKTS